MTRPSRWQALSEREPAARVIVVTSDYPLPSHAVDLSPCAGQPRRPLGLHRHPSDDYDPQAWWHSQCGFSIVLGENAKLLAYQLRYSLAQYAVLAGGLALIGAWRFRRHLFHRWPTAA